MVFNTGAALLDAIVLAVVSKEEEGLMDTVSPRMCAWRLRFLNQPCIRCSDGCRRMTAWRYMTGSLEGGTAAITKLRKKAACS